MKGSTKGTLTHTVIGLIMGLCGVSPLLVGWGFWMREYGEAKYLVEGRFYTRQKQLDMLRLTLSVWPQWVYPLGAALLSKLF